VSEMFCCLLATELLQWIGPQQIAHRTKRRWLLESVQLYTESNQNVAFLKWLESIATTTRDAPIRPIIGRYIFCCLI